MHEKLKHCESLLLFALIMPNCCQCRCRPEYQQKPGITHTSCKPKPNCVGRESFEMTYEMKKEIVTHHNTVRRQFAKGEVSGFPKAANMMAVTWNEELAEVAQDHADRCEFKHDHFQERFTTQHDSVGQCLSLTRSSAGMAELKPNFSRDIIDMFYKSELSYLTPNNVDRYVFNMQSGHLSQVIWALTKEIGAGATKYIGNSQSKYELLTTYTYAPSGNYPDVVIYLKGEPCSQCPSEAYCDDGLCRLTDDVPSGRSIRLSFWFLGFAALAIAAYYGVRNKETVIYFVKHRRLPDRETDDTSYAVDYTTRTTGESESQA